MKTTNTEILRMYLDGALHRAEDHASNVRATILTLTGAIVWAQDEGVPLEIRTYNGHLKNVMWCTIDDTRWCMAYNHETRLIEMRRNGINGEAEYSLDDNSYSAIDIYDLFETLKRVAVAA